MASRSKEVQAWRDGWKRAESIALTTLSGLPLDSDRNDFGAMFRAYQAATKIWERLCSRELRTEDEVKDAAKKIGMIIERDNQQRTADGESPIAFNKFQNRSDGKKILSEIEWIQDIYEFAAYDKGSYLDLIKEIDLDGWEMWEFCYVAALRMIDDAVQALIAGDLELGTCLVFDALNEMYSCDKVARGKERNSDYIESWMDRIFEEKTLEFKLRDKVDVAVGEAVKKDRVQVAKTAAIKRNEKNRNMRTFVIERWNAEKASYEENKSDFARHYSRLLLNEHQFKIEASTIATRWLRGL